jgi:plasmid replication initiation protein
MDSSQLAIPVYPLVVQHNALVNARFSLSELEGRLFLAMLSRIGREDKQFTACRVPIVELAVDKNSSHSIYERVKQMLKDFSTRSVLIDKPQSRARKAGAEPDYKTIPLLAYAEYCGGEGEIEARFNDLLMPYLLELRDNFTKAELIQLLKLKSPVSHRIYWLLREYANFGKRTVGLRELREVLGLANAPAYDRWDNFRARVLDKAQVELADTDLPFTYEPVKSRSNGPVQEVRFLFTIRQQLPAASEKLSEPDSWQAMLAEVGVATKSIAVIKQHLEDKRYDEGYVRFVVAKVQQQAQEGKVQKVGGAVYKALVEGYLLTDYSRTKSKELVAARVRPKAKPVTNQQRQKMQGELEDLRKSYSFAQTTPIYTTETRPEVLSQIQAAIKSVEQRLAQLSF